MKIVFMGTPQFSVPILEALIEQYEVVLVVTQPDKPQGRKKILVPTPVKECALKYQIEVFQPDKIRKDYARILEMKPDMIITAAYGQFIPNVVLECAKIGVFNVHGSLLPKLRGGAPVQKAIIEGYQETGITIMYMVAKMDAGDILAQRAMPITEEDDNGTLFEKMSLLGRDLLMETLPKIIDGTYERISQREEEVTFAYNIKHEEQWINWDKTEREVFNLVRGLSPEPGALTSYQGTLVRIGAVKPVEYQGTEEPGTILNLQKKILVKTKNNAVEIQSLQLAGKKMLEVQSFLNGSRILEIGKKFEKMV